MSETKQNPLVSIAIITYNQKEYLRECLESCLVQDYPNFEIVVADDCSTDGTQQMLKEYSEKNPNKFVLRLAEENQGITPNSNVCLKACSGKYITMVGGDDLLLPQKITRQVEILNLRTDINLCGTYTREIDSKGNKIRIRKDFKKKTKPEYSVCELIESGNGLVPVVSYMFRAASIPEEGFEPRIPVASDALFMCRIVNEKKIFIIKEELTAYRVHDSHARQIGYKQDSLLTHAFVEHYYPHCIPQLVKRKSNFYLDLAITSYLNNDESQGDIMLRSSIAYKVKLKALVLFVLVKFKVFSFSYGIFKRFKQ